MPENEIKEIYGNLEISQNNCKWLAVRTKPRHEKKIARRCLKFKIPYYLPLKDSIRTYKNRIRTFRKPLFSGYIFCKCSPRDKDKIYQTGSVYIFLTPNSQEKLIKELKEIYYFSQKGVKLQEHKYLQRGQRVRVVKGPFTGCEGKITKNKGESRFVLNISLINQAVSVEIDKNMVKPI